MIITVTPNPAVDKTLIVHGFRPGATNRGTLRRVDVGGKGINVARNLKQLGCDVVATGFHGDADHHGTVAMLARHGIGAAFVPSLGELRVNLKVIDSMTGDETEINEAGDAVSAEAVDLLAVRLRDLARGASVVVFSGSLPPGAPIDLYAQLIAQTREAGALTVLDSAGPALAEGIAACPDLVKPNRAEAEELLGIAIADEVSLVTALQRILTAGARNVVISLGPDGAAGAAPDGIWRTHPVTVRTHSTVGAGDAMVAALAYGLERSLLLPEALRLAAAAGCAASATAEPFPALEAVQALLSQIQVEPIAAAAGVPAFER